MIPRSPALLRPRFLLGLLAAVAALPCPAQLVVQLKAQKKELVAYEPLRMEVTITNNSGRSLLLARPGGQNDAWLDFHVTRDNGDMVQPSGTLDGMPPMMMNPGQTIARTLDVGLLYPLSQFGGYIVRAQVWCPPDNAWSVSNNVRLSIVSARDLWSQAFGVPKDKLKAGEGTSRIFKVQQLNQYDGNTLYLRLEDRSSGMVLACYPLGQLMEMHPPSAGIDSRGNLHVLFKSAPNISAHVVIDCDGNQLNRTLYRDVVGAPPSLQRDSSGGLAVLGGRTYDPVAEAQQRLVVRRVSERPPGLLALIGEARRTPGSHPAGDRPVPSPQPAGR